GHVTARQVERGLPHPGVHLDVCRLGGGGGGGLASPASGVGVDLELGPGHAVAPHSRLPIVAQSHSGWSSVMCSTNCPVPSVTTGRPRSMCQSATATRAWSSATCTVSSAPSPSIVPVCAVIAAVACASHSACV